MRGRGLFDDRLQIAALVGSDAKVARFHLHAGLVLLEEETPGVAAHQGEGDGDAALGQPAPAGDAPLPGRG